MLLNEELPDFGKSIQDNNEGNPYQQFKYVFSTGSYIDSLTLGVKTKDAIGKKAETLCDLKRDQEFTNVKFLFCRGFKIDDFRFRLDENGLPITEDEMLY